jgi:hypothetical protein
MSIINLLQGKLAELDELVKKKRVAKAEFSYSLSKSLLKTISNLSMEVMNLNQINVKGTCSNRHSLIRHLDKVIDLNPTQNYLSNLNEVLRGKFAEIEALKANAALTAIDEVPILPQPRPVPPPTAF